MSTCSINVIRNLASAGTLIYRFLPVGPFVVQWAGTTAKLSGTGQGPRFPPPPTFLPPHNRRVAQWSFLCPPLLSKDALLPVSLSSFTLSSLFNCLVGNPPPLVRDALDEGSFRMGSTTPFFPGPALPLPRSSRADSPFWGSTAESQLAPFLLIFFALDLYKV